LKDAILRWVGGKHTLAPFIIEKMHPHNFYIEVFAGGLHVYWQKGLVEGNIVNDVNKDLVNLYRVVKVKSKTDMMIDELHDMFYSRDLFNYLRDMYRQKLHEGLPDYMRAALFLYLNWSSFNGMFTSWAPKPESKLKLYDIRKITGYMFNKLNHGKGTVIENCHFRDLLTNHDKPGVLFYLDPPYWITATSKGAGYYEFVMNKDEHIELRDMLIRLKHAKFIMSYDDVDEVRELYKDGYFRKMNTPEINQSSANRQTGQMGLDTVYKSELLIANYDLEKANTLFE